MSTSELNKLLVSVSDVFPEYLSDIESWHRHIPFAFVLMAMLKPRQFVELGTHRGDSYCSFCQAVIQYKLNTRCYAVDTWAGDSQAGHYAPNILANLKQYHDVRYKNFSTLMQMDFNAAINDFEDGSIDLLHIDGLHTYDAVKHDFETWLPKVSQNGVILFHDTAVINKDFGVWKLWQELSNKYRGCEFKFGFGLGVLLVGDSYPELFEQFIQEWTLKPKVMEQMFYRLGDGIELKKQRERLQCVSASRDELGRNIEFARNIVEQRDVQLKDCNAAFDKIETDLIYTKKIIEQRDSQIKECNIAIDKIGVDLAYARDIVIERDNSLAVHIPKLQETSSKLAYEYDISERRKNQIIHINALLVKQKEELRHISHSRWWGLRNQLYKKLGHSHRVLASAEQQSPNINYNFPALELPVDIVIPVYGGFDETRNCIESVLANKFITSAEIVVINDATTDVALRQWLESISDQVTLLHNEVNKGFVATVNRGMNLHHDRDVLLLNSDTVVANNWLDRIQKCAYKSNNTASVTPLSNNATICSYPNFCEDNVLPSGYNPQSMDALTNKVNAGKSVVIPTAVGFCMYIRRDSLNQAGLFDEGLFGRGYGEENEFCMRSAAMGWQHLLCEDTFVYHAGGVSFADTQNKHQQAGHKVLISLYPDYDLCIQDFIKRDPGASGRFMLDLARFYAPSKPVVLMINHGRGGGTERHIKELAAELAETSLVLMLKPYGQEGQAAKLYVVQGSENNSLYFDPLSDYLILLDTLKDIGLDRIHFHHTIGIHPCFWQLPEDLQLPFDYTIHDYYLACPQITMTDLDGNYCGEPDDNGCNRCLNVRPAPGNITIDIWRDECGKLINAASRVFVPSNDVATRMSRYFPNANLCYAPHEKELCNDVMIQPIALAATQSIKVLVIGALSNFKGADLLEACAIKAYKDNLPIEFHLIGFGYRNLKSCPASNLYIHGRYEEHELEQLIKDASPHLIWFPGSCPETYSYTLSICFKMGLPVMAHAIGAFSERLAGRKWSWLLKHSSTPKIIVDQLLDIRKQLENNLCPEKVAGKQQYKRFLYKESYIDAALKNAKPNSTINWQLFNSRFEKLACMQQINVIKELGVGSNIFYKLQRVQAMPMFAKLSKTMPPRVKYMIKSWLTGLGKT